MKIFIITAAMSLLFSIFTIFQAENNNYLYFRDQLKMSANDAADAAALFYDEDNFSEGIKVFNKSDGNDVIAKILKDSLPVNDDFTFEDSNHIEGELHYTIYYFDGNETLTTYENGVLLSSTSITFPYTFEELSTNYTISVSEPMVVVTLDAGTYDYSLPVITDPEAIRTSGYEYIEY